MVHKCVSCESWRLGRFSFRLTYTVEQQLPTGSIAESLVISINLFDSYLPASLIHPPSFFWHPLCSCYSLYSLLLYIFIFFILFVYPFWCASGTKCKPKKSSRRRGAGHPQPSPPPYGRRGGGSDQPPLPCPQILGGPNSGSHKFSSALCADKEKKDLLWFHVVGNNLKSSGQ